jgi:hypothetical protein
MPRERALSRSRFGSNMTPPKWSRKAAAAALSAKQCSRHCSCLPSSHLAITVLVRHTTPRCSRKLRIGVKLRPVQMSSGRATWCGMSRSITDGGGMPRLRLTMPAAENCRPAGA